MAKTSKRQAGKRFPPARQAAVEVWSPDALREALKSGSSEDKLKLLRQIGIVTSEGKLSPTYSSWGHVSRTDGDSEPSA
ncbi:MAG: hypothetical protein JNK04_00950 [Myxococcales bacterium]|nr:hypothetical protein [Myxococcales bacterium]